MAAPSRARRHPAALRDLQADLPGELQRLAERLGYQLDQERAAELAAEASLERMRARAEHTAPETSRGAWKDPQRFFRKGASGDWRELLDDDDLDLYHRRVAAMVDDDMAMWLHAGRLASGVYAGWTRPSQRDLPAPDPRTERLTTSAGLLRIQRPGEGQPSLHP